MEANTSQPSKQHPFTAVKKYQRFSPNDSSCPSSQIGNIGDLNIGNLREGIKNAMIPLLIKVFELKLAAQQAKTPPSRLQKQPTESLEKIREQLQLLLKDLELLHLWCESSQKQVIKALKETEELQEGAVLKAASPKQPSNPAIEKSFSEAVASQSALYEASPPLREAVEALPEKEVSSWLRKLFPW